MVMSAVGFTKLLMLAIVDSIMAHPDALDGEGENEESTVNKAQDLHSMIAVLLESYVNIQETGFVWDLHYRNNVYKDVKFVLFTVDNYTKCSF